MRLAVSFLVLVGFAAGLSAASLGRSDSGGSGLTFLDCVGAVGAATQGCSGTANLSGAIGVAASPDGQSVYVAAPDSDALETFSRGGDGRLTPAGCLGKSIGGPGNCTPVPDLDLQHLVISPDGQNLYVVGQDTLSILSRRANGSLASMGCVEFFHAPRAQNEPHCAQTANLSGVDAIAVSPDGNTVYAGSTGSRAVEVFNRGPNGALTPAGCLGDPQGPTTNCAKVSGLGQVLSLAVSPDGKNVYAGSEDAISILDRDAGGAIHGDDCVRNIGNGPTSCTTQASVAVVGGLALTADGKMLYATSALGDDVEEFARSGDGSLTEVGCVGNVGTGPKSCTGVSGLDGPTDVLAPRDSGRDSVYVTSATAVQVFSVGSDGSLSPAGCVVSNKASASGCDTASGLNRPEKLAISPTTGAGSLYVTALDPGALVELKRTPLAAPPTITATTSTTATTTSTKTTTTTPLKKKAPAAAITGQIISASFAHTKRGKLTLLVKLHVSKLVSVKAQVQGTRHSVVASLATALTGGSHTLSLPLGTAVTAGAHQLVIVLRDGQKHQRTLTTSVVVPRS